MSASEAGTGTAVEQVNHRRIDRESDTLSRRDRRAAAGDERELHPPGLNDELGLGTRRLDDDDLALHRLALAAECDVLRTDAVADRLAVGATAARGQRPTHAVRFDA